MRGICVRPRGPDLQRERACGRNEHMSDGVCECNQGFRRTRRGRCAPVEASCPRGMTGTPPNCRPLGSRQRPRTPPGAEQPSAEPPPGLGDTFPPPRSGRERSRRQTPPSTEQPPDLGDTLQTPRQGRERSRRRTPPTTEQPSGPGDTLQTPPPERERPQGRGPARRKPPPGAGDTLQLPTPQRESCPPGMRGTPPNCYPDLR